MKHLLVLFALSTASFGFTQTSFLPYDYSYLGSIPFISGSENYKEIVEVEEGEVLVLSYPNKKTKYLVQVNENGKPLLVKKYEKGAMTLVTEMAYHKNILSKKIVKNSKGEVLSAMTSTFNERGNPVLQKKVKKGKTIRINKWEYNEDRKVVRSAYFEKGKEEPKRIWTYAYYEDGQRQETILTKGKNGKEIHRWNYDCKPEGELVVKKDETSVCKDSEVKDDVLIQTFHYTDDRGQNTRMVQYSRLPDTTLFAWKRYDAQDQLKNESIKDEVSGKWTTHRTYKKGKLKSESITRFNAQGQLIEKSYNYDGKTYRTIYKREGEKVLVESYWKDKLQKKQSTIISTTPIEVSEL